MKGREGRGRWWKGGEVPPHSDIPSFHSVPSHVGMASRHVLSSAQIPVGLCLMSLSA